MLIITLHSPVLGKDGKILQDLGDKSSIPTLQSKRCQILGEHMVHASWDLRGVGLWESGQMLVAAVFSLASWAVAFPCP